MNLETFEGLPGENLDPETRRERILASLRLSGQLDSSGLPRDGANPHLLIPRQRMKLRQEGEGSSARIISEGEYHADEELQRKFLRVRRALLRAKRFFILHGPPGSGKDTFMEEVAAGCCMPYRFFSLGGNTDLNHIKGGDGIAPHDLYKSSWQKARELGRPLQGENGEELWELQKEFIGAVPRTQEIIGEIVRWMREPSVIVLQEPEGQQEDMVQFHSALGDRLGDPSQRKVFVDSAHGQVHSVHPDCIVAITHNARPGQRDFTPATKDRAVHLSFGYPASEIEAERLARAVEVMMAAASSLYPSLARSYSGEELLVWAEALSSIRRDLEGKPAGEAFGFRTAADVYCEMLQAASEGSLDPIAALTDSLDFLYVEELYSPEERAAHIRGLIADREQELLQSVLRSAGR